MSMRAKLLLGGIAGIVVLVLIYLAVLAVQFYSKNASTTPATPTQEQINPSQFQSGTQQTQPTNTAQGISTATPAVAPESAENKVLSIALPFVETIGTYSNQNGGSNLTMILPNMTDPLKTWAEKKIVELRTTALSSLYNGVTTKSLAGKVVSVKDNKTDGDAQIKVATQRTENMGSRTNTKTYSQDALVTMKKVAGAWMISQVDWQTPGTAQTAKK